MERGRPRKARAQRVGVTKRRREARPTDDPPNEQLEGNADNNDACVCEGEDDAFQEYQTNLEKNKSESAKIGGAVLDEFRRVT